MVWPSSLDGTKSRGHGRKLPASRSVKQPTIKEILQAGAALGLSPEPVEKAALPRLHWEKLGGVVVKKSGSKLATLKSISSEIVKARQREAQAASEPRREKR